MSPPFSENHKPSACHVVLQWRIAATICAVRTDQSLGRKPRTRPSCTNRRRASQTKKHSSIQGFCKRLYMKRPSHPFSLNGGQAKLCKKNSDQGDVFHSEDCGTFGVMAVNDASGTGSHPEAVAYRQCRVASTRGPCTCGRQSVGRCSVMVGVRNKCAPGQLAPVGSMSKAAKRRKRLFQQ